MVDIPRTFDPWGEDRKYRAAKAKLPIVAEVKVEIDGYGMVSIPDIPILPAEPTEDPQ